MPELFPPVSTSSPAPTPTVASAAPAVPYAGGASSGVAVAIPPESALPSITAAVNKAVAAIPADKTGALVTIFTPAGANLCLAQRIGGNVRITAWIGKRWTAEPGEPAFDYGAAATVTW